MVRRSKRSLGPGVAGAGQARRNAPCRRREAWLNPEGPLQPPFILALANGARQGGAMAVFVFRVAEHQNGNLSWPKECRDADEARAHAAHVAIELAQDASYHGCHVEVTDESGQAVGRVAVGRANP